MALEFRVLFLGLSSRFISHWMLMSNSTYISIELNGEHATKLKGYELCMCTRCSTKQQRRKQFSSAFHFMAVFFSVPVYVCACGISLLDLDKYQFRFCHHSTTMSWSNGVRVFFYSSRSFYRSEISFTSPHWNNVNNFAIIWWNSLKTNKAFKNPFSFPSI